MSVTASRQCTYVMRDAAGSYLYIGCTEDLGRRLSTHAREREWFGEVSDIRVEFYPDDAAAMAAERRLIETHQPAHNVHYTTRTTPRSLPCRRCRVAAHLRCLGVNRLGQPCPCSVCPKIHARRAS